MQFVVDYTNKQNIEEVYRIYVTDCLLAIAQNTGRSIGSDIKAQRYIDLISNKANTDRRNANEIIDDMKNKLNSLGGDENG